MTQEELIEAVRKEVMEELIIAIRNSSKTIRIETENFVDELQVVDAESLLFFLEPERHRFPR